MRTFSAPAAALVLLLCLFAPGRVLAQGTTVVGDGTPGSCSAAALSSAIGGGGAITFNCGAEAVTIAGGPYTVAGAVTIDGGGLVTLSGENAHRHFVVAAEGSLRLADLTLAGGSAVEGGGSILSEGALVLDTVTVRDNQTTGVDSGGGAIANLGGALTIVGSNLFGNEAGYTGGAILQSDGVTVIEDSVIDGNRAPVFGAIDSTGDLTIRTTVLRGNRATAGDGGAVGVIGGTARIEDSLIEGNFAGSGGGGVYISPNYPGTMVTIQDTRITQNETDATFAGSLGGGIFSGAGLTLVRVTVDGNRAYGAGGLFQYGNEGLLTVHDSTFYNNTAVNVAGGLWLAGALGHTFTNVTVSDNTAGDWAGGLYVTDLPASLQNVTLSGNRAPLGANIYTLRTTVTITSTIIANPQGGGENCTAQDAAQPAISGGYNLDSDSSCELSTATDLPATDPLLGALADNGGPTFTHLPQPGSPALDAVSGACPATDQRGFTRPGGARCDVGSVEVGGQLVAVEPVAPVDNASRVTTGNGAYYWVSPRQCNVVPSRPETIARRDVQGATPPRLLYQNPDGCGGDARLVRSNIVADQNYLFYVTDQGLMRLALTAQAGAGGAVQHAAVDNAELINTELKGVSQIALNASEVVGLDAARRVWRIAKMGGAGQVLQNLGAITNVKSATAFGVNYIYWQNGVDLIRYNPSTGASTTIATGVVTYFPLGGRRNCQPGLFGPTCTNLEVVLISRGNRVDEYNALTNQTNTLYTSNKWIYELAYTEAGYVLALEEESNGVCLPGIFNTCLYTDFISRIPLRYGDRYLFVPALPAALIYNGAPTYQRTLRQLGGEGDYVLWVERGQVRRLPLNTATLPNVRVTGMEVTQGIQNINNAVTLVKNRRTFVRVYVQSTHGAPLRGVSATLTGYSGAQLGVLQPALQGFACSGAPGLGGGFNCTYDRTITAQVNPDRRELAQSFLFELPLSWTNRDTPLRLVAQINPDRAPVESNFDDNRLARDFTFRPSGRFEVQFVQWGYRLTENGPWIYPTASDIDHIQSYIRRTYPVATTTSTWEGFHPSTWRIADANMGLAVNRNAEFCDGLGLPANRRAVCAATYSNQQMERRRYTWWSLAWLGIKAGQVIPDNVFMYGVISDTTTSTTEIRFPRGTTPYNGNESSGPTGRSSSTKFSWDPDGIYGDWYAAHEIGHAFGLRHPATGNTTSDGCTMYTQPDVDTQPDHQFSRIGANNDTLGFDVGDNRLGIGQRTYAPQDRWHDFMSYCSDQWISDQNYERLYAEIREIEAVQASASRNTVFTGDWWLVQGGLHADGNGGAISHAERLNIVSTLGERTAGAYAIQLLRADGAVLAAYPFTPQEGLHDAPTLQFTELVTNVQGTTALRIVRVADGLELARRSISPHPPVVSNVTLPAPVSTAATSLSLTWSATDADGDALAYDVYYSLDGGATLLPLRLSLPQPAATVDIERLPGGTAIFRVVATDGANTAFADSAPFVMPQRAPAVRIDSPAEGATIRFGQSLNFTGYALDPQDGPLGGDSLTWRIDEDIVATGEVYEAMLLPVGVHQVTLTAVNGAGIAASTTITVAVVDDLTLPGSQVAVAPSAFNFSFNLESSVVQIATMSIADIGEALEPLSWTVTISGATWLTVDVAAGVTPAQIVLTASAAGLSSGSVERGSIELNAATPEGSLVQRLTIPVTRSAATTPFGSEGVQPSNPQIFLPMIQRR